ncbi:hypothetical protein SAMN00777080_0940 [Aquiflexum balticum DSM 16537]|uniref:Uncharacterized protein n=1 Tax=Aquiflexum balticum DSM 16537 TaxID=758820 RepID=A0A1W2H0J3_9BACT|nr:hypothetical protein [Aquiflexum balticum]SMD42391.1 hypothetical protein SAMN00777080_0940 [Aquiflexum balticum DSM 16537]
MAKNQHDTFSPEMLKILKIFGIGSLLFVFVMSFFNERRANNSGKEESPMSIGDAERLYFKNVRAAYYDIEDRKDAKMTIYRYGKRAKIEEVLSIELSILLNKVKDEAYIFVESSSGEFPIKIRWSNLEQKDRKGELVFEGGDKFQHLGFVEKLYPLLLENTSFELWNDGKFTPILVDDNEKEALLITVKDYFKLINSSK